MKRVIIIIIILLPTFISGQQISLQKLLTLQKKPLIGIQDFLDSNSWSLSRTVTVAKADSFIWNFRIRRVLDSLSLLKFQKPLSKKEIFDLNFIKIYEPETPLYLVYYPINEKSKNSLTINDFTIRLPKQSLFLSLALGIDKYWTKSFHQSIEITYKGQDIKDILHQVALLKIPKDSSYIVFQDPTIKRVYKYKDQIIAVTIFNLSNSSTFDRTYSIEIYDKSDYLYVNEAELELRGKTDNIQ